MPGDGDYVVTFDDLFQAHPELLPDGDDITVRFSLVEVPVVESPVVESGESVD